MPLSAGHPVFQSVGVNVGVISARSQLQEKEKGLA